MQLDENMILFHIHLLFYLKDQILKEGFVSPNLSRQITWRIVDTYTSWYNYLHNLIMPNPQSMVQLQESQGFNDEEKEKIMKVMPKLVLFGRKNSLIGLTKDKKEEAKFIDDSLKVWKEVLPILVMVNEKTVKSLENVSN